jgi:hypothetical protein
LSSRFQCSAFTNRKIISQRLDKQFHHGNNLNFLNDLTKNRRHKENISLCVIHKSASNQNKFTFSVDSFSLSSRNHSHKQFVFLLFFLFSLALSLSLPLCLCSILAYICFSRGSKYLCKSTLDGFLLFSLFATKKNNRVIICNQHRIMVLHPDLVCSRVAKLGFSKNTSECRKSHQYYDLQNRL